MLKIEDKLFHGIDLVNYGEYTGNISEFEVLEMILQSKRICTREQLQQEKSSIITYLHRYHGQASNEVCLAYHPNNYKYPVKTDKYEDAFYDFIFTNISIIINERLLLDKHFQIRGIPREIRIEGSIYLPEYIEAIGYLDKINYVIKKINYLIENEENRQLK